MAAEPAPLVRGPFAGGAGLRDLSTRYGILVVAAVLFAVFAFTASGFPTVHNMRNLLVQVAVIGVVTIGETIVMLTGGIDLSVGSTVLLSSVVMSDLYVNHGWPAAAGVAVGIGVGLVVGLVNGVVTTVFDIEPIIVTLGTLLAAGGLGQILLNGNWITVRAASFTDVAVVRPAGIPLMVWIMLGLYLLGALVMYRTSFGASVYAIGNNRRAAVLSGLAVRRRLVAVYALSGLLAGVAGYIEAGQLGVISQNDGSGMEFSAILAVLIGGLSVKSGGIGRLEKSLVGAVIAGMIANYLVLEGVPGAYEQGAVGFLILAAVLGDHVLRRREAT